MKSLLTVAALLSIGALPLSASATTFKVQPGGTQLVEFISEAPIEDIRGLSTDIGGSFEVDDASPEKVSGTMRVPVKTLKTGNTTRDGHLQGKQWLDAANHPDIVFVVASASFPETKALADGVTLKGKASGELTIKGVTQAVTVPIRVSYLAASDKLKKVYIAGNAIRVKTKFEVKLADFGVKAPDHLAGVKVADTVTIKAALTAVDK